MSAIAAALAILLFLIAFTLLHVVEAAGRAIRTTQRAVATIRDPTLGEDVRERAVQRASISLMGSFVSIVLRGAGALLAPLIVVFGFEVARLGRSEEVIAILSRGDVIILSTVAITAGWMLWRRLAG